MKKDDMTIRELAITEYVKEREANEKRIIEDEQYHDRERQKRALEWSERVFGPREGVQYEPPVGDRAAGYVIIDGMRFMMCLDSPHLFYPVLGTCPDCSGEILGKCFSTMVQLGKILSEDPPKDHGERCLDEEEIARRHPEIAEANRIRYDARKAEENKWQNRLLDAIIEGIREREIFVERE